jgi:hypothetical protein
VTVLLTSRSLLTPPEHVFHQALTRFPSVLVYANVVNDATVPFPSAAIEADDPFVQWCERGIEVDANDTALVSDWHFPPLAKGNKGPPKGWHLGVLPPTLRFRWPLNYVSTDEYTGKIGDRKCSQSPDHPRPLPDPLPAAVHPHPHPFLARHSSQS